MTAIFRGWEDFNFSPIGGPSVDETAGTFRAGYGRCSLISTVGSVSTTPSWWRIPSSYGISISGSMWLTTRFVNVVTETIGIPWLSFKSAGDISRFEVWLGIKGGSSSTIPSIYKVDASGNYTLLATGTAPIASGTSGIFGPISKLDINLNYSVGGSIVIYGDGDILLSFFGDVTTEGNTILTGLDLLGGGDTGWSEIIWDTCDTRSWSLVTQAPVANGNTDNWSGGASDVNEIIINDTTNNKTSTDGAVQEYTVNSLVSGDYVIVDYTIDARAMNGLDGGPTHIELGVRTGGNDFFTSNLDLGSFLQRVTSLWTTNPNTGLNWTMSDLDNTGFNIGMKATA